MAQTFPINTWRVLDTGIRPAAENIALNRALLEARQQNIAPNTLRFLGFQPCALLGFHQSAEQELNLQQCQQLGVTVQRRITGGGAIYMDEGQLGWELYLDKRTLGTADMTQIAQRICTAAAMGLQQLGVAAQFRPRNDIEVQGKKISGTGGAFDGDALMYQGTLLMHLDVDKMLRVLNIPAEKLSAHAIQSARERMTSLQAELGALRPNRETVISVLARALTAEFGVTMQTGVLSDQEHILYQHALADIDHPDWVDMICKPAQERPVHSASQRFAGGSLQVNIALNSVQQRLKQVWFSGDVFINPRRTLIDLECALRDVLVDRMDEVVLSFFADKNVDMLALTPRNIIELLHAALQAQAAV